MPRVNRMPMREIDHLTPRWQTFRLDYVGTKAGIKGASVVMGYLETGMRVLDSASALLARMQELAVWAPMTQIL